MISSLFKADAFYDSLNDIDFEKLYHSGIRTLIIDIDNTLIPYYQNVANEETKEKTAYLKKLGFNIIIYSNNWPWRVKKFADSISLPTYSFALKPLKMVYKRIIRENKLKKDEILCLGDQLITDVLGARRMGLKVFYIKPLVEKDSYKTIINRKIERYIFKKIINEKM